jgi:hypothetical protein
METIIAAAISAAVTLAVCVINSRSENEKTRALLDYRLSQLELKQDKHNNVIERTFILEGQMLEAQHDIKDLKAYHKPKPTN